MKPNQCLAQGPSHCIDGLASASNPTEASLTIPDFAAPVRPERRGPKLEAEVTSSPHANSVLPIPFHGVRRISSQSKGDDRPNGP
jgi:hypothetical protein